MNIESCQLRYFIAVAEELSFSRAALRLNITQPPLSMQIKALEAELGTLLFNRTRHAVSLTEAGCVLLDRAREAVLRVDHAGEAARLTGRGEAGVIRIGFVGAVPMLNIFSPLLRGFRQQYPFVRIDLQHMNTGCQIHALRQDQMDIAFVRPPDYFSPGPILKVHLSWPDRLMIYVPTGHRLAQDNCVNLGDVSKEDFVGIASTVGCGVYEQMMALCALAGFIPRLIQETNDLQTVLWLVAAGIGIALLPECYTQSGVANVVARPLSGEFIYSQILLVIRNQYKLLLVDRFIKFAKNLHILDSTEIVLEPTLEIYE